MPEASSRSPNPRRIALVCLTLGLAAPVGAALAAERSHREAARTIPGVRAGPVVVKPVAAASAERTVSWTAGEPEARACSRTRRKLWQDGEGWIVKAVRSCP